MDRVYGREQYCLVCGRAPSVGFLYVCRQDHGPIPSASNSLRGPGQEVGPKSELRQELEEIGLSESVILAAERGEYTPAQLAKLKALKMELKQAIEDTMQGVQINGVAAKLAAFADEPSNHDGASSSSLQKDPNPQCKFKACHTCRPYYKDRVYISFEAVLAHDFAPVTPADAALLPTKPASNLRFIGLLPNPILSDDDDDDDDDDIINSSTFPTSADLSTDLSTDITTPALRSSRASIVTFKTTQTDMDELSAMRRPRRRFYNLGHRSSQDIARDLTNLPLFGGITRQGLKSAIQGIFRPSRDSSSSGSNITLPLPRTGTARDLSEANAVREFDVGTLRRVRRQKERNDLRNGTYVGGFEGVGSTLRHRMEQSTADIDGAGDESEDSESDFTVYSCASEGSEVEVDGGVALTEEAVETHVPDILTPDILNDANGKDVGAEDGEDCIMAQV
ncbi:hypothetical protein K505DRAFT_422025 [Melanomma pulvis-pyrius CBS 109.77]|uniref:Uncharacterized protein n=1 Tax=Melanomma pulvis-pyrius CBS 109.77 TaxID=1314802 RepID=A0A6A6WSJ5_9PLEO|nr:hypothetical protein K505DRAFT_422025 [Melanomma pulvis-pyrius CBS 109.77]